MTTQFIGKPDKQYPHSNDRIIDKKTGESLVAKHKASVFLFKNEAEQIHHSLQQANAMQSW